LVNVWSDVVGRVVGGVGREYEVEGLLDEGVRMLKDEVEEDQVKDDSGAVVMDGNG
jgi:hypothetical protein